VLYYIPNAIVVYYNFRKCTMDILKIHKKVNRPQKKFLRENERVPLYHEVLVYSWRNFQNYNIRKLYFGRGGTHMTV
jgi:hypothetical protein